MSQENFPLRADDLYSCKKNVKPILHDTLLTVTLERDIGSRSQSPGFPFEADNVRGAIEIRGSVVTPLRVSLSRLQYEQLLDTVHRLFSVPAPMAESAVPKQKTDSATPTFVNSPR
jgi:vacuolar protein sorting-associated protein 13D